jgi:hypothetical protein
MAERQSRSEDNHMTLDRDRRADPNAAGRQQHIVRLIQQ